MDNFADDFENSMDDEPFDDDNLSGYDDDDSVLQEAIDGSLDWEDIAFLGAMSEEIAEDETRRRRLERQEEKERDDFDDPM